MQLELEAQARLVVHLAAARTAGTHRELGAEGNRPLQPVGLRTCLVGEGTVLVAVDTDTVHTCEAVAGDADALHSHTVGVRTALGVDAVVGDIRPAVAAHQESAETVVRAVVLLPAPVVAAQVAWVASAAGGTCSWGTVEAAVDTDPYRTVLDPVPQVGAHRAAVHTQDGDTSALRVAPRTERNHNCTHKEDTPYAVLEEQLVQEVEAPQLQ